MQETMTQDTLTHPEVRSFRGTIPKEELVDLRWRIAATRWPDKETVADRSQGVQLAKFRPLVEYWGTDYDWRKVEARLNAFDIPTLPVVVTVFPAEIYRAPRSWGERAFGNLIYWNEVDKGGHFAASEQPELFAQEVRAAFRSLR